MARAISARKIEASRERLRILIRKDDMVKVIAGRDKGKTGRVLMVDREKGRVLVEGIMMAKKHTRRNPAKQIKGGIAERESPISVSNVMVMCPSCGPVRIGHRVENLGGKARRTRICRKCGAPLDKKA